MVSTSLHTPTHDLKSDFDLEDMDVDKLADLKKNDVFDDARQRVGAAWCAGQWLDFRNGLIKSPRVHPWPVNDADEPFEPRQLNEVYAVFVIPDTYCLCVTQEFDPTQCEQYTLHIQVASCYILIWNTPGKPHRSKSKFPYGNANDLY
ncbi:hypothetical protein M422DRAFT_274181 [Sphaerobolus stellatus SS14]|uniref:Uncharacterized protein n=1 Tax=Sphaerobolus stellatus (strain SS14) TaxID=990650 RepID=A0A0C9U789_SPHS4|nr:hypothetical protein M422DRAFT_274181 [Sphaerobolus stellatus SS14]